MRRVRVIDTMVETVHNVNGSHVNSLGILHGGFMLRWLIDSASIAASRLAGGYSVLASLDYVFLVRPVRNGEVVRIYTWVSYVGRSSMEVASTAYAGAPGKEPELAAVSHMCMVAVDENIKPRPVGAVVVGESEWEKRVTSYSLSVRRDREGHIADRRERVRDLKPPRPVINGLSVRSYKIVNPHDSLAYGIMHAGSLLFSVDELAVVAASRLANSVVVTGSVDHAYFYSPIRVGEIVEMAAAVTYIGRSSMEVTVKAVARNMEGWAGRHVATARLTMVPLGPDGEPRRLDIDPSKVGEPGTDALHRVAWRKELLSAIKKGALPLAAKPPLAR